MSYLTLSAWFEYAYLYYLSTVILNIVLYHVFWRQIPALELLNNHKAIKTNDISV